MPVSSKDEDSYLRRDGFGPKRAPLVNRGPRGPRAGPWSPFFGQALGFGLFCHPAPAGVVLDERLKSGAAALIDHRSCTTLERLVAPGCAEASTKRRSTTIVTPKQVGVMKRLGIAWVEECVMQQAVGPECGQHNLAVYERQRPRMRQRRCEKVRASSAGPLRESRFLRNTSSPDRELIGLHDHPHCSSEHPILTLEAPWKLPCSFLYPHPPLQFTP